MKLLENADTLATAILRAGILIQKKLITVRTKFVELRWEGRGRARVREVTLVRWTLCFIFPSVHETLSSNFLCWDRAMC